MNPLKARHTGSNARSKAARQKADIADICGASEVESGRVCVIGDNMGLRGASALKRDIPAQTNRLLIAALGQHDHQGAAWAP